MKKINISVIMACYNGEKYIIEQLESLKKQTLKPDEVIICDDKSTDNTVDFIKDYINKYNLTNWKVLVNDKNIGWKKNFHSLLNHINGDIVFFSDQDDVWKENKIELMVNEMKENDNIKVLSCKADFIDSAGNKIWVSTKALPFGKIEKIRIKKNILTNKFIYSIVPGCTMAIKSDVIEEYKKGNVSNIPHDALYWKMATLREQAYIINIPLISYRIHKSNASSPTINSIPHVKSSYNRIQEIKVVKEQIEFFKKNYNGNGEKDKLLEKLIEFCNWRLSLYENKDTIKKIFCYFKYFKFYNGFKMFCGDVVAIINYTQEEKK